MLKSISNSFHAFTILTYVLVKYSQNQLKLVKYKFTEVKNEYPHRLSCPRSLSGTDNQLFGEDYFLCDHREGTAALSALS